MYMREERNRILNFILSVFLISSPLFSFGAEQGEGLTSEQATFLISLAEDAMHLKVTVDEAVPTKPIFFTNYKTHEGEISRLDVLSEVCKQAGLLYDEHKDAKMPGHTILSDSSLDEVQKLELQLVRFGRWLRSVKTHNRAHSDS